MKISVFRPAEDGIPPESVPSRTLYTGAKIPVIGLGTFGSDNVPASRIAEAVLGAAAVGYRHFDCAAVYGNEKEIGYALKAIQKGGVPREELWITSKLWNDKHAEEDVIPTCKRSLADLQLDYLDLYLIHWPFPNHSTSWIAGRPLRHSQPFLLPSSLPLGVRLLF